MVLDIFMFFFFVYIIYYFAQNSEVYICKCAYCNNENMYINEGDENGETCGYFRRQ